MSEHFDIRGMWTQADRDEKSKRQALTHPTMLLINQQIRDMESQGWNRHIANAPRGVPLLLWFPGQLVCWGRIDADGHGWVFVSGDGFPMNQKPELWKEDKP